MRYFKKFDKGVFIKSTLITAYCCLLIHCYDMNLLYTEDNELGSEAIEILSELHELIPASVEPDDIDTISTATPGKATWRPTEHRALTNSDARDSRLELYENEYIDPAASQNLLESHKIDGRYYSGIIEIPALDIELPVISTLTDNNLKVSPCIYYGSIESDNLIIGGHNYKKHFARLGELQPGDKVVYTEASGTRHTYYVNYTEYLSEYAVKAMKAESEDYRLTLFTCNKEKDKRITVRCY